MTNYEEQLQEVEAEVAVKPVRRFVLALSDELAQAKRKAVRAEGVSMQTLVNLWVQERLQKYSAPRG